MSALGAWMEPIASLSSMGMTIHHCFYPKKRPTMFGCLFPCCIPKPMVMFFPASAARDIPIRPSRLSASLPKSLQKRNQSLRNKRLNDQSMADRGSRNMLRNCCSRAGNSRKLRTISHLGRLLFLSMGTSMDNTLRRQVMLA